MPEDQLICTVNSLKNTIKDAEKFIKVLKKKLKKNPLKQKEVAFY